MVVLLDTNVIIDVLNDRRGMRDFLKRLLNDGHRLGSCGITVAEIYAGMRRNELLLTEKFLAALEYFPLTESTARRAGKLKASAASKGKTLALADVLIAATALEHDLVLATDNRKDFPMQGLEFISLPAR